MKYSLEEDLLVRFAGRKPHLQGSGPNGIASPYLLAGKATLVSLQMVDSSHAMFISWLGAQGSFRYIAVGIVGCVSCNMLYLETDSNLMSKPDIPQRLTNCSLEIHRYGRGGKPA
jgi:hypothetical protein